MSRGRLQWRCVSQQFQDEALEQVPVRIGETRIAAGDSVLCTIGLGSCVAVALYDGQRQLGGMAHAMLPRPSACHRAAPRGRFATTAVADLLDMLRDAGAARQRLRARRAGGASMFAELLDGEGFRLGRRNVEAAREALAAEGIPIDGEDVFGTWGRSVYLRTKDGRLLVTSVHHDHVYL
jgi:chemotaxis protein CheD